LYGWDYNRAYDTMALAGKTVNAQRVCPPYGEEPLGGLWMYAVCWPELWHKMLARVPGAATAGRYANTELYGYGRHIQPPPGMNFREWTFQLLELYPPDLKAAVAEGVGRVIRMHKEKTNRPLPDSGADPLSGISWEFLANIANRGDLKQRRAGNANQNAIMARERAGLSLEDAADGTETDTRY
jgi:predicted phosphoadenosine phosphosulfate sulfurtransferase